VSARCNVVAPSFFYCSTGKGPHQTICCKQSPAAIHVYVNSAAKRSSFVEYCSGEWCNVHHRPSGASGRHQQPPALRKRMCAKRWRDHIRDARQNNVRNNDNTQAHLSAVRCLGCIINCGAVPYDATSVRLFNVSPFCPDTIEYGSFARPFLSLQKILLAHSNIESAGVGTKAMLSLAVVTTKGARLNCWMR
jgi:hypothetical protein